MSYLMLAIDVAIILGLCFGIYHALRLSRQLDRMQADREAFEKLIQALNTAAARAEAAVRTLKEAAQQSGDSVQEKINAARSLSEELEIMIQAGDNLAERLGSVAEQAGKSAGASARQDGGQDKPRTSAEQGLLEAVKAGQKS